MSSNRTVPDIQEEIDSLIAEGYRLDMIVPADAPRIAHLSRGNQSLKLVQRGRGTPETENSNWIAGRAGMQYRDLIPDRLGGFLIASHIRLIEGGDVPDYVHYHKLLFQVIYCRSGWVRVVYEDQGPPFEMNVGDCVLQPPEIRHRVLESSACAEVVEVSAPAVHETWVDHEIRLPTERVNKVRDFHGQMFVRHVAADAVWIEDATSRYRDTGIGPATGALGDVRVFRTFDATTLSFPADHTCFVFMLDGEAIVGVTRLRPDDSIVVLPNTTTPVSVSPGSEVLRVALSPELAHFYLAQRSAGR